MQASSFPTPEPGGGPESSPQTSLPGPSTAPPREPAKRRTALWGTLLALAVLAGGAAFYLNTRANQKVASKSGGIVTIATVAVGMGGLNETIRVSGTIAAQNFAALLAPRISGSRGDFNRGGDRGGGGGGGMGDFSLVLLKLENAGKHVKAGDVVAEFDPQFQSQRLDDYKDSVVQLENTIKKMLANLAATKEAHDQDVRTAKADWDKRPARPEDRRRALADRRREVQAGGGRGRGEVQAVGGGVRAGGRIPAGRRSAAPN